MKRLLPCLAALSLLTACTSTGNTSARPLVPDQTIQFTSGYALPLAKIAGVAALAAVAYVVFDPLAPNWEIEETRVSEETYRLALNLKRFHTGGAGESLQALRRRAEQLAATGGFGGYQLLEYSEGIDSQTLGTRRVANGTIRLVQRQQADSFALN